MHSSNELARSERLHDVVVGSLDEPEHTIVFRSARREHEDRHARSRRFEPTTNGDAVELGQPEIEHDEIEGLREPALDGRETVAYRLDGVLRTSQEVADSVAEERLVLDEENSQRVALEHHYRARRPSPCKGSVKPRAEGWRAAMRGLAGAGRAPRLGQRCARRASSFTTTGRDFSWRGGARHRGRSPHRSLRRTVGATR